MATRKWLRFVHSISGEGMFSDDKRIAEVVTELRRVGDIALVRMASGTLHEMMWDIAPPEVGCVKMELGQEIAWGGDPSCSEKEEQLGAAIEAHRLIHGDRARQYGSVTENFGRWSDLCQSVGINVEPYDLAILMALGKLARQVNKHKRDNIVDAIGYLDLAQQLLDADEDTE